MKNSRKLLTTALAATMLAGALTVSTPASAWRRSGWGPGVGHWGYNAGWRRPGWGYGGWGMGAGMGAGLGAGLATGLALGAATSYPYGSGYWGSSSPTYWGYGGTGYGGSAYGGSYPAYYGYGGGRCGC